MNEIQMKNNNAEIVNEAQAAEQSGGSLALAGHESAPSGVRVTLRTLRAETEMQAISQALQQTGWNRKRAALNEIQMKNNNAEIVNEAQAAEQSGGSLALAGHESAPSKARD